MIEIILTLLTMAFLYYLIMNFYFKRPFVSKEIAGVLSGQGINVSNPKTIIDSVKEKLQKSQEQEAGRAKELEDAAVQSR